MREPLQLREQRKGKPHRDRGGGRRAWRALRGTAAIASAKRAFVIYSSLFGTERFASLAAAGARPQRAERTLRALADLGIDQTTRTLERESVEKFVTPFGALMQAIERAVERTGHSRTKR